MRLLSTFLAAAFLVLPISVGARSGPKVLICLTDAVGQTPSQWWHGDAVEQYLPPLERLITKKLKGFRIIKRESVVPDASKKMTAIEFARSEGAAYVVLGEIRAEATGMSNQQGIQEVLAQVSLRIHDTRMGDEHASASSEFRMGRQDLGQAAAAALLGATKTAAATLAKTARGLD